MVLCYLENAAVSLFERGFVFHRNAMNVCRRYDGKVRMFRHQNCWLGFDEVVIWKVCTSEHSEDGIF